MEDGLFVTVVQKSFVFVRSINVCSYLWFPLKDDHTASFVPCGQELSCVVELYSGDDIRCSKQDKETKMEYKEGDIVWEEKWKERDKEDRD